MIDLGSIRQLLRPLQQRVSNLVARAVVNLVSDDVKMQVVQLTILEGETREGAERFQEYGFTSVPLEGAEAVVLSVGGRRDHLLVVAVDDRRNRLKDLVAGEVALYTDEGAKVHLKRGRIVVEDSEIRLGSDSASSFVALAGAVEAQLNTLKSAISATVVVAGDGGASFKATLLTALATWPSSTAASKVKAE
jgi:phage baseplate assembly protein V